MARPDTADTAHYTGPIAWMSRHGVAPNLLMLFLIVGGFLMSLAIRKEFIPPYEAEMVVVSVGYPGATPTEIEQGIVLPIENELASINNIKEVTSSASQGSASVSVELQKGGDLQQLYLDVQQAVGRINTFPAAIETPRVKIAGRNVEVLEFAIFGPLDGFAMKRLGEAIKDELLQAAEISQVELRGTPDEEIHVEISGQQLQRFGLTLSDIASQIGGNAVEQSAGTVRTPGGDILVTLDERRYWAGEFLDIPVVQDEQGVQLRLGDIATVREGFEDTNERVTYNGQEAIRFKVYRSEDQTPVTVVDAAYKRLDEVRANLLPPGVELVITDDDGKTYSDRVGLLLNNAIMGLILVIVLLSLFLEYRLAFWVTMGIPTAFLGAMLLLPLFDVSINMFSMFAFIIALGIVVDDAIIAGENIYEHMQKGMSFPKAAIEGAREVAMPLAFAILTNVVAFLPLLTIPGRMGSMFVAIPVVVISCFIISWIEALFIMPTHLASMNKRPDSRLGRKMDALQLKVDAALSRFIQGVYLPAIRRCTAQPVLVIAVAVAFGVAVLAWPLSGRMGFSMFPRVEGDKAVATVELASNAPFEQAEAIRQLLEAKLMEVIEPVEAKGHQLLVSAEGDIEGSTVEIEALLVDAEIRPMSTHEVARRWREAIGDIPGIRSLALDSERGGGPSSGAALTVELRGSNTRTLAAASADLVAMLEEIDGVKDVANSFTSGKPQWDVQLNDLGRSLGLQADDIAAQIRASLYGARALRQQRLRNEVTVLVRLPQDERRYSADIERLMIRLPSGGYVPLAEIATLNKTTAPAQISRRNGQQIVTVTASVEPREQIPAIMSMLQASQFNVLKARYSGVDFGFEGRQADTEESKNSLAMYGGVAVIMIYVLLALPFRSYSQPLLIMLVIPFGSVGAVLGHMMMGYGLSIISIMGIVALSGVVVNDSLILIDYANRQRLQRPGLTAREAALEAGVRRFRPILLTTLTTFLGLAPMLFENSRQARFIMPMAVSLGFGILFTTFICLLVLPAAYVGLDSVQRRLQRLLGGAVATFPMDSGSK
ncbi:efflux RND transporter permease subunit [Oceanobacter mangrovi]|uniref:efflux RND transporter permease subunit n=1 Tax=Oceanobacter mangrovi TaxID=2862510 RepID=UPI001C8D189A|nr:efflux RND transporter permease subunit [Oceanobacter mangrovi]